MKKSNLWTASFRRPASPFPVDATRICWNRPLPVLMINGFPVMRPDPKGLNFLEYGPASSCLIQLQSYPERIIEIIQNCFFKR